MRVVARLGEQILGAPGDDVLAEIEERAQHVVQRQHLRPAAVQRDHVGAEARLQRGEAPELVQHHVGDRVAPELDDDAHAVAIGFVAQVRDALDALLAHQLGDPLDQRRLVDLVGDLADDQRLAILAQLLDRDLGAHDDRAAAGRVGRADAGAPEDRARRSGSRARESSSISSSSVMSGLSIIASRPSIVSPRLCGGMLVAMPTAMPPAPLTSRFGKRAGRTTGSELLLVVVRLEVDGVLVEVVEQRERDAVEPRLGVAGGRRRIAVDRAEVALAVDERGAHREVLRHAHQRVVDRQIAVRMVLAHRLADRARRLVVGPVGREVELVHRVEDAPVDRLEAVANVGQGAAHDHAHRVIEIAAFHFVEDRDGLDVGRPARSGPLVNGVGQREGILNANRAASGLADFSAARHSHRRLCTPIYSLDISIYYRVRQRRSRHPRCEAPNGAEKHCGSSGARVDRPANMTPVFGLHPARWGADRRRLR